MLKINKLKQTKSVSFLIGPIFLLVACSQLAMLSEEDTKGSQVIYEEKTPEEENVTVTRVIDGDTIVFKRSTDTGVEEFKGRLLCLNAPENTTDKEKFGEVSTAFLKELIEGKEIEIIRDIDLEDPYGRELIHVFYNGKNVNELLIKKGLARVAYLYDEYKFINDYNKAEKTARTKEVNIWSIPNYVESSGNGYDMSAIQ